MVEGCLHNQAPGPCLPAFLSSHAEVMLDLDTIQPLYAAPSLSVSGPSAKGIMLPSRKFLSYTTARVGTGNAEIELS